MNQHDFADWGDIGWYWKEKKTLSCHTTHIWWVGESKERRRMKLKMYQDKYLCLGIFFNHAKFLKDLTCQFLFKPLSTILLFNVLAHRYQIHRKNNLIEAKQIVHLNHSISVTAVCIAYLCHACVHYIIQVFCMLLI